MFRKKRRAENCDHLEGVVTFFGSHSALRAESLLAREGIERCLVPGPREISPNCGVALRFPIAERQEVERLLAGVEIEAIHHYPEVVA